MVDIVEQALIRNCALVEKKFGTNSFEYTNAMNAVSEYHQKLVDEKMNYLNDYMLEDIKNHIEDFSLKDLIHIYLIGLRKRSDKNENM